MISPTTEDIGRKVIYTPSGDYPDKVIEEGVLSSFNDHYIFVRFGHSPIGVPVSRDNLDWLVS